MGPDSDRLTMVWEWGWGWDTVTPECTVHITEWDLGWGVLAIRIMAFLTDMATVLLTSTPVMSAMASGYPEAAVSEIRQRTLVLQVLEATRNAAAC